jgi:nicotinamidase-related amidase
MSKPALLIIDMLNDSFISEQLIDQRTKLCNSINRLLSFARARQFHIIWVRQEFKADLSDAFLEMRDENINMYIEGTPGSKILEELQRSEEDHEIIKKRYSAFFETELDNLLTTLNPSCLVLAGVNTHACIRTAAIDAYQRDYRVLIIEDCVASPDKKHHDVTLDYLGKRISKVVKLDKFKVAFNSGLAA